MAETEKVLRELKDLYNALNLIIEGLDEDIGNDNDPCRATLLLLRAPMYLSSLCLLHNEAARIIKVLEDAAAANRGTQTE